MNSYENEAAKPKRNKQTHVAYIPDTKYYMVIIDGNLLLSLVVSATHSKFLLSGSRLIHADIPIYSEFDISSWAHSAHSLFRLLSLSPSVSFYPFVFVPINVHSSTARTSANEILLLNGAQIVRSDNAK